MSTGNKQVKVTDRTLPKIMKTEENIEQPEPVAVNNKFNQTFNPNKKKLHNRTGSIINKKRIWDMQPSSAFAEATSIKQKKICCLEEYENEEKVKENKTESVNIIREANNIMKERNRNHSISVSSKTKSIKEYILDNKEINLKNYLIGLLKGERTYINDKELNVTKALKNSEIELDMNLHQFNEYSEKEKSVSKGNEQVSLI